MSAYPHLAKMAAVLTIVMASACHADGGMVSDRSGKEVAPMSPTLVIADVAGAWGVEAEGAKTRCVLSLSNLQGSANRHALAENCIGTPFEAVRSWRLAGATFELLDVNDRVIARFRQTGVDSFESTTGSSAMGVRLTRAAAT